MGIARNLTICLCCILLSLLVYSSSLNNSWHLDDYPNIVHNQNIHLDKIDYISVEKTFYSHPNFGGDILYRPLACLSFGLNWFFDSDNVFWYHIVNIILHGVTGFLLYLVVIQIMQTPNVLKKHSNTSPLVALLVAAIWLLHPIQTQAVTYIVQRMAILAGLFYLASFLGYLKFRLATNFKKKKCWLFFAVVTFGLGYFSKENVVVLPFLCLIAEFIFFLDFSNNVAKKRFYKVACLCISLLFVFVISLFYLQPHRIDTLYSSRAFTLFQRLLSENRILVFYLGQLFFPSLDRLSLFHDFEISTSFLDPPSTIPAIIFNVGLIVVALIRSNKNPLISFAILSYFCGHLVESTFLPLELIFEHRNYIPSMFIFLPFSIFVLGLGKKDVGGKVKLNFIVLGVISCVLVALGFMTYQRNKVWFNSETLWLDVYSKAPNNARALQNLAMVFQEKGQYRVAIGLYNDSLKKYDPSPTISRYLVNNNLGNIYEILQDYDTAILYYLKALDEDTKDVKSVYNIAHAYVYTGQWEKAKVMLNRALIEQPENYHFLNTSGFVAFKTKEYAKARVFFQKALDVRPFDRNALLNMANTCDALLLYDEADFFLIEASRRYSNDIFVSLVFLEHLSKKQDGDDLFYDKLESVIDNFSPEEIEKILDNVGGNELLYLVDFTLLKKSIFIAMPKLFKK